MSISKDTAKCDFCADAFYCVTIKVIVFTVEHVMPHRIKIDENGHYCPFPGITIVANTMVENKTLWESVFHYINGTFSEYFSALPPSSYHMTTTNLFTDSQFPDEHAWDDFLDKNLHFFEKVSSDLFLEQENFTASIQSIFTNGVIQLCVSIPETQREKIHQFAASHGLDKKLIPAHFHITLAYQYQRIPTKEIFLEVTQQIETALREIFKAHETFQFSPARLNYFLDMTAFHDWDGHSNPFHSGSTHRP